MKIKYASEQIVIYLYRYNLDLNDSNRLNKQIKSIFIKLIKVYGVSFSGYFKVDIYENKKYGYILEIEKVYNSEFNFNIIDLKITIHSDVTFYLKTDDYPLIHNIKAINIDGYFYINLDDIDNFWEYIEFGSIEKNI